MLKKIRIKFIGLALLLSLVITSSPQPVLASSSAPSITIQSQAEDRISGLNRYETALRIAEMYNNTIVDSVILASGQNFPDALAASVLAKKMNAPILLVNSTPDESKEAFSYISNHLKKDGTIYIAGGTGVVSPDFRARLIQMGYPDSHITQIGGLNRNETATLIAKTVNPTKGTRVMLTLGDDFPDALTSSSFAAYNGWPLLLIEKDRIPDSVKEYLMESQSTKVYLIGNTSVLNPSLETEIKSLIPTTELVRLGGATRYETEQIILDTFAPNPSNVYLASGSIFADALAGSILAAQTSSPIVLLDPAQSLPPSPIGTYLRKLNKPSLTTFGGNGAISDALFNEIKKIYDPSLASDSKIIEGIGSLPSFQIADNVIVEPNFNLDTLFIATATGSNFTHEGYLYRNSYPINTAAKAFFSPYTSNENAKKLFALAQNEDNKGKKFNGTVNEGILAYDQFLKDDLIQSFELKRSFPWGASMEEYKNSVQAFAKETNATEFFKANLGLYQTMLNDYKKDINFNHVPRLEEFYGVSKANDKFVILLSSMMNGGQAFEGKELDGTLIHYNVMDPTKDYLNVLYHETAHNFFKSISENKGSLISQYAPYKNAIGSYQPTDSFESALNETLARAVTVILLENYHGKAAAINNMNNEMGQGWKNLDEITALIKNKYLSNRSQYRTFEDFLPFILDYIKAKSLNQPFDIGPVEKNNFPKNGLVLGGKEESEAFRKFNLPITKNGWGWISEINEHDLVVWLDYPGSQSPKEAQNLFGNTTTTDRNYLSVKVKDGKTLVHLKAESKEKLLSILNQLDQYSDLYTQTYKQL